MSFVSGSLHTCFRRTSNSCLRSTSPVVGNVSYVLVPVDEILHEEVRGERDKERENGEGKREREER